MTDAVIAVAPVVAFAIMHILASGPVLLALRTIFRPAMSNPRPSGRMRLRVFSAAQLRFSLWQKYPTYWQPVP